MKFTRFKLSKSIQQLISKLHVIDLIGIGLFLLIVGVAAVAFLRRSSFVYVTLQVSQGGNDFRNFWFDKPTHWYLQNLKVGMTNKDVLGRVNLELTDMYYYPSNKQEQTVYITLKTMAVFNKRTQQHSYQGQPLLIGEHRLFKLGSVSIPGLVHKVSKELGVLSTKQVIVEGKLETEFNEDIEHNAETRFSGIKKYIVEKIKPGLIINNSKGESVAKILEVDVSPAYREFIYQDSLVKVIDNERQNVRLVLELVLNEVNGRYLYMEEEQVLLGDRILLPLNDFTLRLTVEDIKQLDDD